MSRRYGEGALETGYAEREVAKTHAHADEIVAGITAAKDIVTALIDTAKANPIMGIVLAVVTADVLQRTHIITPKTEAFIFTVCGVAFGVEVGLEAVEGISSIIGDITGHGSSAPNPADLVRPSPTTVVENPPPPAPATRGGSAGAPSGTLLSALMGKA